MTKKAKDVQPRQHWDLNHGKPDSELPLNQFFEFVKTQYAYGTITEAFYDRLVLWGLAINKDAFERGQKTKNK